MSFWQSRASYSPMGRQPFKPGQWQGFKGVSKSTTYIQNNFFGSSYGGGFNYNSCFNFGSYNRYNDCGCNCNGGRNKWMNWMMGIGIGTSLLGSILNMFGIGGGSKQTSDNETAYAGDKSTKRYERTDKTSQRERAEEVEEAEAEDEVEPEEADEAEQTEDPDKLKRKKEEVQNDILTVKKQEVKTTTNYPVKYGDTWANIITAKYKDESGKPISFTDAKELWTKLKGECEVSKNADGMPPNIELPNEFKNYKLDINGTVTANKDFDNPNFKKYDGKGFTSKTNISYTASGTINGKYIGTVSGTQEDVTAQLKAKGFTDKDINEAMQNGEVKITKQNKE